MVGLSDESGRGGGSRDERFQKSEVVARDNREGLLS